MRDRLDAEEVVGVAVSAIDTALVFRLPAPVAVLALSHASVMSERAAEDPRLHWSDPHHLSVCWAVDPQTRDVGALVLRGHRRLADAVATIPEFTEFSYWNDTDPPVGTTDEQWVMRQAFWQRVIPSGRPSDSMREWVHREGPLAPLSLVQEQGTPTPTALACVPSRAARATSISRRALTSAATRAHPQVAPIQCVVAAMSALSRGLAPEVTAAARALVGEIGPRELTGARRPCVPELDERVADLQRAARRAAADLELGS
ncbi:hypothetical protein CHO01_17000 [Cellulomonas hominis]|uniref:Uncharacterized protein n=1 Tax=Cellulomonas hominis TaxID=156981 RepID=A0A511FDA4_9CELL|nr:hypothetical protein [Cellulomonas hominis]MBB5474546.1 hypothetical protein [Cellulomonas hominis]GEL46584.1 hypothetical protein CHO01_17000 [Cellulomonas hominis]